jgi:O-Antigen ligase
LSAGLVIPTAQKAAPRRLVLSTARLQNLAVWLLFASGFLVFIEPAPFEIFFAIAALIFLFTGLRLSLFLLPLILLLVVYNIGGALSLVQNTFGSKFTFSGIQTLGTQATWFIIISIYMAIMAVVCACIFSENVQERLRVMRNGYVLAGCIASIFGIIGYFDIGGTAETFTRFGRAMGTFKDPNVFSTFLVLPIVMLLQGIILGTSKRPFLSMFPLLLMIFGVFLSFSRGAWGVLFGAMFLTIALSFVTAQSVAVRSRIVLIALTLIALLVVLLVIALQFEAVRSTFEVRASLNQAYDVGETGRFGNQLRSIPLLLDRPHGFGPYGFRLLFPEDPHNTFINAFASYGWTGGIAYLALIFATIVLGWRLVFLRTPWQRESIAVWSTLFLLILQGIQIDTDHWRHFYVLVGMVWGLSLASLRYGVSMKARQAQIAAQQAWIRQTG